MLWSRDLNPFPLSRVPAFGPAGVALWAALALLVMPLVPAEAPAETPAAQPEWQILYNSALNDYAVKRDWIPTAGNWEPGQSGIRKCGNGEDGLLILRQPVCYGAVRITYEARADISPGDLSLFFGLSNGEMADAAFFAFGSAGNTANLIRVPHLPAATTSAPPIVPGQWHTVTVVRAEGRLTLAVDGSKVIEAADTPAGYAGAYIGLYAWNAGEFRHLRVEQRPDSRLKTFLKPAALAREELHAKAPTLDPRVGTGELAISTQEIKALLSDRARIRKGAAARIEPPRNAWPMQRGDAERSGYTPDALPDAMTLHWEWQDNGRPQPAWSGRDTRMPFDAVYHPVVADGRVFLGSSANDKVYALDARTGAQLWVFYAEGPIRFAPACWRDRVFVGSDDGMLYCLDAARGRVLWQVRAGPGPDRVLGNGRMISRWPVRGGPVVRDDTVYFAAGIWPSEGVYVLALDALTGRVKWRNYDSGNLRIPQPHGDMAHSGISAQGYLAADADRLYVPSGRAVPAVFGRTNGALQYFHLAANPKSGGADMFVADGWMFNRGMAFASENGRRPSVSGLRLSPLAVTFENEAVDWSNGKLVHLQWGAVEVRDRSGKTVPRLATCPLDPVAARHGGAALIVAGRHAVSAGPDLNGTQGVSVVSLDDVTNAWSACVEGIPYGLAAVQDTLLVSTDQGRLYAFGPVRASEPARMGPKAMAGDAGEADLPPDAAAAAARILKDGKITAGYCVDLGAGDGTLAMALARGSDLRVLAVEKDPEQAGRARVRLDRAGLLGARVEVHTADPVDVPFADGFANLVVSRQALDADADDALWKEARRLQRPYGGVAMLGQANSMRSERRGVPPGAGEWTHLYADAAGSFCGNDTLARSPLRLFWFTDFGFDMPNRHGRGTAPLFQDGLLVIAGLHAILGVDAYNGHIVWRFDCPDFQKPYHQEHLLGVAGTGGGMCLGGGHIYARQGDRCLRLNLTDGRQDTVFALPGTEPGQWGFLAWEDGVLLGSRADTGHVVRPLYRSSDMRQLPTQSTLLFAYESRTGRLLWSHAAEQSMRHNAIVAGGGRVYLIDRPLDARDRLRSRETLAPEGPAALICLDLRSGKTIWQKVLSSHRKPTPAVSGSKPPVLLSNDPLDLSDRAQAAEVIAAVDLDIPPALPEASASSVSNAAIELKGTTLALSVTHQVLIMGYQLAQRSFQLPSEKDSGRLTAFDAKDGALLWDTQAKYISRPILNDLTIYAQPSAWDLLTGALRTDFRLWDRQPNGCGPVSGSRHLLFYRSGTLAYYDLPDGTQTRNFGGVRPGCWVNAIVGGGLLLMPDATDLCTCSYPLKASIALQPAPASIGSKE